MKQKIGVTSVVLVLMVANVASAVTLDVGVCSINSDRLTVARGEEVIWRVPGGASLQFTVIPAGAKVPLRSIEGGDYAATFTMPGEYRYIVYCPRGDKGDTAIPAEIIVR